MYRTILFLSLILLLNVHPGVAQKQGQQLVDSLSAALPAQKDDSSKVRLLNNLSFAWYSINPAEGLRYAGEGLALARRIGWREGEADARNKLGINYFIQSEFARALEEQQAARKIYESLGQAHNIPRVQIAIGSIYQRQGDYARAAGQFSEALRRYTALGDQRGMATGYGSLGNVYKAQGDYVHALQQQLKALEIFEKLPHRDLLAINLKNTGDTYLDLRDFPNALAYFFRATRLAGDIGNKGLIGENMLRIGRTYFEIAADSGYNPTRYRTDTLMPPSRGAALAEADGYLSRAAAINSEVGNMQALNENYRLLAAVAELKGNYQGALAAFSVHKNIQDSLAALERRNIIARMQSSNALALEEKQRELDRLDATKKRNEFIFASIAALMLAIIAIRSFRRRRT